MKNNAGFTLVELTVVIMVILILAAMAIPRFSDVSDSARQARCVSNIRCIEQAILLWENRNNMITGDGWVVTTTGIVSGANLSGYVKDIDVFNCPKGNRAAGEYYYDRDGIAASRFPGINCWYYGRVGSLTGDFAHTYYTDDPLS